MNRRLRDILENTIVVIGLLSLWPLVAGCGRFWYQCVLVLIVILLAILAMVRLRRVSRAFDRARETKYELGRPTEGRPSKGV